MVKVTLGLGESVEGAEDATTPLECLAFEIELLVVTNCRRFRNVVMTSRCSATKFSNCFDWISAPSFNFLSCVQIFLNLSEKMSKKIIKGQIIQNKYY